jgi:serine/threonine-protein kinase
MTWVWVLVAVIAAAALGWIFFTQQEVTVPNVVGFTQEQATVLLNDAGLRVGRVTDEPTLEAAPGEVMSQSPAASEAVAKDSAVDLSVASIPKTEVPDVVGKTQSEATAILAENGLLLGAVEYEESADVKVGYVIAQEPEAGAETSVGTPVSLTTSKGGPAEEAAVEEPPAEAEEEEPPAEEAEPPAETPEDEGEPTGKVPDVVGLPQADAESTLEGVGFKSETEKAASEEVPAGEVVSQSPRAGTVMAVGSTVKIVVSKGAPEDPKATVPDVIGMGVLESIGVLRDANLTFAVEFAPAEENYFKVAAQDPQAGTEVDPGTKVTITVGLPDIESILEGLLGGSVQPLPAEPSGSEDTTP